MHGRLWSFYPLTLPLTPFAWGKKCSCSPPAALIPNAWHILALRRTTEAFVDGNTSPWSECPSVAASTTPPTAWPTNARLISAVSAGIKGLLAGRAASADALRELVGHLIWLTSVVVLIRRPVRKPLTWSRHQGRLYPSPFRNRVTTCRLSCLRALPRSLVASSE